MEGVYQAAIAGSSRWTLGTKSKTHFGQLYATFFLIGLHLKLGFPCQDFISVMFFLSQIRLRHTYGVYENLDLMEHMQRSIGELGTLKGSV